MRHIASFEDSRYMYVAMESLTDAVELQELIDGRVQARRTGELRMLEPPTGDGCQ